MSFPHFWMSWREQIVDNNIVYNNQSIYNHIVKHNYKLLYDKTVLQVTRGLSRSFENIAQTQQPLQRWNNLGILHFTLKEKFIELLPWIKFKYPRDHIC